MSIEISMPALSPTMTKGILSQWMVNVGDSINIGDVIAEIETDKVTIEVEAETQGIVSQLVVPEGTEDVPVGEVILRLKGDGEEQPPTANNITTANTKTPLVTATPVVGEQLSKASEQHSKTSKQSPTAEVFLSPIARRMARQGNLDASKIKGTGPKGRIVKSDIEAVLGLTEITVEKSLPLAPAPVKSEINYDSLPTYTETTNSSMRQVIASRLTKSSRDIPHFYMSVDCELDALLALRKQLNSRDGADYKISVNDFIVKAIAVAMKKVPAANSMWADDSVLHFEQVDIAIAVALEDGLITPVIRNVNGKGLAEVSNEAKSLVEKARQGKLKPADYQGGTFTISNLGMFGIKDFTSIINPPQNGILSVGAGEQRAVVKEGSLAVATVMTVTLAMDHRCVDGLIGARFIQAFKSIIEDPIALML